jgi:hypothetical protein
MSRARAPLGCLLCLSLIACSTRVESTPFKHPLDAGATPPANGPRPQVLLFNGAGTSANDVAAVEAILNHNRLDYSTADSSQLNQLGEARLKAYRLLIIPGGNFLTIGNSLTPEATLNIHRAVQGGLSYLGICAGAFLAGHATDYRSLDLTSGAKFRFYSAETRGIRKEAVAIVTPDTLKLDQYWEDGPELSGWGMVIGKYPDGTPAIVEGSSGEGWVVLSGVHPEAPESWRRGMSFHTSAETDNDYAAGLIQAALKRVPLPHY